MTLKIPHFGIHRVIAGELNSLAFMPRHELVLAFQRRGALRVELIG